MKNNSIKNAMLVSTILCLSGMAKASTLYECHTDDAANVFKYISGNTLNLIVKNKEISLNAHVRVWNQLELNKVADHALHYTSKEATNFLQNGDLEATLPEEVLDSTVQCSVFKMEVLNKTTQEKIAYTCTPSNNLKY